MFGSNLRKLRRSSEMTQRDLGKELNVSPSTIALWETDQRLPDAEKLLEISKLFSVSIDWILDNENHNNEDFMDNTVTIIGKNGIHKTFEVDDDKIKALELLFGDNSKKSIK